MQMKNDMLLFHGSYCSVKNPDLSFCKSGRDFGVGFYLTSDLRQAKRFIVSSFYREKQHLVSPQVHGFVSVFQFQATQELETHIFSKADALWLEVITGHRRFEDFPKIVEAYRKFDVIAGKVANDKTNAVITAYLTGLYGTVGSKRAVKTAISLLRPYQLVDQFCFRSEKALLSLKHIEVQEYFL